MSALTPPGPYVYRAVMLSNYDGDTIRCDVDLGMKVWLHDKSVRLFGIDTPELRTRDPIEKKLAEAARDIIRHHIPTGIGFLLETLKDEEGKYGRLLGRAFAEVHGQMVCINDRLVEAKLAQPYFGAARRPWSDWYAAHKDDLMMYIEGAR